MTTYDLPTLRDLLVRVEAATGPDRELDGRIWAGISAVKYLEWDGAGVLWQESSGGLRHQTDSRIPLFTASIDAVVALIERVLPEGAWGCGLNVHHRTPNAHIHIHDGKGDFITFFSSPPTTATPALALLAALLKALIAMEEQNEQG